MSDKSKLYQYASKGNWSSQADKYEVLKGIESQQQRIAELEQREAELAAHVERLRDAGNKLRNDIDLSKIVGAVKRNFANEWDEAAQAAPPTNLNAVRREAYVKGFYQAAMDYTDTTPNGDALVRDAEEEARKCYQNMM